MQELNLCYKYNPIYWNTANLIVDSGAVDEQSNDATNYGKMATAIALIQKENVEIEVPLVETADFGFKPDIQNNKIIFGLKGINGINTDISQAIIQNRPYKNIEDFAEKFLDTKIIQPAKMVKLIKGGCFTKLHSQNKKDTMEWYLRKYLFSPCEKLTLSQLGKIKEMNLIPDELQLCIRMINFKKYVLDDEGLYEKWIDSTKKKVPKRGYHDGRYVLDNNSQMFFMEHFSEESVVDTVGDFYLISEKKFIKEVDSKIQPLKDWMELPETLEQYNDTLFQQLWKQHADGTMSSWAMSSLCFYDREHELENVQEEMYGIVNFNELPEQPEPYDYYTRYINGIPRQMPKYKISRIAGTVLNADNSHHMVTILTKYGPVNVKMNKGHYAFYSKRISARLDPNSDTKTVLEDSWLKRGNMIAVAGVRREDTFWPMIYKDTIYKHTVNLIKEVYEDGTLLMQTERTKI